MKTRDQYFSDALARISRNGGKVDEREKIVRIPENSGIKVWGALDCLVNYFGYTAG